MDEMEGREEERDTSWSVRTSSISLHEYTPYSIRHASHLHLNASLSWAL